MFTSKASLYIIKTISIYIVNIGIIIAPILCYTAQSIKFKTNKTSYGFENTLCMNILISKTLIIFFWFEEKFTIYLFIEAIEEIIMQFVLLTFFIIYRDKRDFPSLEISEDDTQNYWIYFKKEYLAVNKFWKWNNIIPYIIVYLIYVSIIFITTYIIGLNSKLYFLILSIIYLSAEILLYIPQIITNYKLKNADALSIIMVCCWLIGNIILNIYYFIKKTPLQFIISGFCLFSIYVTLLIQIIYYHKGSFDFFEKEIFGFKQNDDITLEKDDNNVDSDANKFLYTNPDINTNDENNLKNNENEKDKEDDDFDEEKTSLL